ncbi:Methyltransferase type 11 domain-containing protein [Caenorhabditis elegans]|uniref:Methyltransferase type 11 domain-containing protein n=1 Tax=Caenorhabditis elegans TaxID=6239 RepID=C4IWZ6_CAEEL|nr:Methyltransferase type 11 domain-containing protein [Caenorhabditis elegans]CCD63106.1 Methyltransferase type 11 domain-containing protein [Caenorhabditis elegans]|eukprot:NP_001256081.1 Uncharacterized protein CELE_C13A2.7 [Caenorhabditis elegans]
MHLRSFRIFSNKLWNILIYCATIVFIFIVIAKIIKASTFLLTDGYTTEEIPVEEETTTEASYDLSTYNTKTRKGLVTLEELNEKVFNPLGFEIIYPSFPIPTLRMTKLMEPTCATVFSEYLETTESAFSMPDEVSNDVPQLHKNDFLMSGYAAFKQAFPNGDEKSDCPKNWDRISELMELGKEELIKISDKEDTESMFSALHLYPVKRMSGLVVGSVIPWLEVMALQHGAASILTVESNELDIEEEYRDRLSSIDPLEFSKKSGMYTESFDFAATFAFVERSGLGLNREPMNPIGDLREIMKIKCVLKRGGLLYLGIPYGIDSVKFHSHRTYGSLRLAMMFSGFEWVATFSGRSPKRVQLKAQQKQSTNLFGTARYTFVLRKI